MKVSKLILTGKIAVKKCFKCIWRKKLNNKKIPETKKNLHQMIYFVVTHAPFRWFLPRLTENNRKRLLIILFYYHFYFVRKKTRNDGNSKTKKAMMPFVIPSSQMYLHTTTSLLWHTILDTYDDIIICCGTIEKRWKNEQ